ncbi:MAG: hypothetical protein IIY96_05020 [Lachnospiraceae bacterium]|nr:hypothetical protein [Lachnospiraceae bacterium]MBQ2040640.1 hypothetical protein [Lachnospiraceae bacterium]
MPDGAYEFVTTDDPEEKELADAAMICRACNAFDGTHYGEPLDADLYVFALDGAGEMKAVLAAYCMGGTFEGRPVTEAAAFTLPEARRQGLFVAMLEALKEEPEGAAAIRFAVYETETVSAVLRALGAKKDHDELLMRLLPDAALISRFEEIAAEEPGQAVIEAEETEGSFYCHSAYSELHIRTGSGSAYIYGVQTSASVYRKHHALRLLAKVILHFYREGSESFLLEVSDMNLPAVSLYRRLGFFEEDRLSYYYF